MFQNYTSAYERLLEALVMMGDRLSVIELHASIWCDSDEFKKHLVGFYKSMIDFWSRALKHYQRNRLLTLFRSFLSGYDVEFKKFEEAMDKRRDVLKDCANALQGAALRDQGGSLQGTAVSQVVSRAMTK